MTEVPEPRPGPKDVVVAVAYAGVNPSDRKEVEGGLADAEGRSLVVPGRTYTFPLVTGRDAAGTVVAVGSQVTDLEVGQTVVTVSDGPATGGTFAELVRVRSDRVAPVPAGLDLREAAALPVVGTTAWQALGDLRPPAATYDVLVHGGAGGVGTVAVQLAALSGAHVAATARSRNAGYVRSLGAERVIDNRAEPLEPALRAWRPDGVDVVVDAVGGPSAVELVAVVRPGGRLVSIATITDDDTGELHEAAARRGVEHRLLVVTSRGVRTQLTAMADLLLAGRLTLPRLQVVRLEDAAQALVAGRDGGTVGKVVLEVGGGPTTSPVLDTPSERTETTSNHLVGRQGRLGSPSDRTTPRRHR